MVQFIMDDIIKQLYEEQPSKTLYHYTSLAGLMGMVEKRNMWASEIHYLNDTKELRLLGELLNHEIRIRLENGADPCNVLIQFREWIAIRQKYGPLVFVGSYTEEGNLLSQWRGYCPHGSGVSIGFNPEKLIISTKPHSFMIGKCIYDNDHKIALAKQLIDVVVSVANERGEALPNQKHPTQSFHDVFAELEPKLLTVAALIKDHAFREEKEWRIVSPIISNYVKTPIKYREGATLLIPFMEVPLPKNDQQAIDIEHIFLGPTPENYLSINSISMYLSRVGAYASILNSAIPYRNI